MILLIGGAPFDITVQLLNAPTRTCKNLLYPALLGKRDDLFVSFCFLHIVIYILQMLTKVSIINVAVFTNQEEFTIVFVASITTKQGKRIYARQFGKKAFPIKVKASKA